VTDQPKQTIYGEYEGTGYSSVVLAKISAQNDSLTMSDYTTITTVLGFRKDTGAAITTTVNANIVTVTSALSNVNVILLIFGQRA